LVHALAAICGIVLAVVVMGCMSISIGKFAATAVEAEEPFCQEGECSLAGCERDVYYPIPFAHPPNLEVTGLSGQYELLEQREDHFRIRGGSMPGTPTLQWKAKGVRAARATPCSPSPVSAPLTLSAPASSPALPPPTSPTPPPVSD
jgi:hypothetical protein